MPAVIMLLLWLYLIFFNHGCSWVERNIHYDVSGKCINELVQDAVEQNWGIRNFYEAFSRQPLKDIPWVEKDSRNGLSYLMLQNSVSKQRERFGRVSLDDSTFSIFFGPQLTGVREGKGWVLRPCYDWKGRPISSNWNDLLQLYYYRDYKEAMFSLAVTCCVIPPVAGCLFLFLFYIVSAFVGKRYNRSFVAIYTWITFALWVPFLWSYFPHPRNYSSSYQDTWHLMRENEPVLRRVLNEQPDIALVELPFLKALPMENGDDLLNKTFFPGEAQERNIHNGIGFVSKKPFFPYDYIRVNVDLFNYLFYAPGLTEENLVEINPKLTYRSLGEGIWLGQYSDYIKAVSYLLLAYLISSILWAVVCGISIWFLWSDIRGWLKRRKLKSQEKQEASISESEV